MDGGNKGEVSGIARSRGRDRGFGRRSVASQQAGQHRCDGDDDLSDVVHWNQLADIRRDFEGSADFQGATHRNPVVALLRRSLQCSRFSDIERNRDRRPLRLRPKLCMSDR